MAIAYMAFILVSYKVEFFWPCQMLIPYNLKTLINTLKKTHLISVLIKHLFLPILAPFSSVGNKVQINRNLPLVLSKIILIFLNNWWTTTKVMAWKQSVPRWQQWWLCHNIILMQIFCSRIKTKFSLSKFITKLLLRPKKKSLNLHLI